ncbi:hypothetical protein KIPB_003066 [Kipferlia bialata]|uniref:Uncharacterized protein n=1 Tax=Kipferlia bialata TaxID=797122 RepID=A0A9K3GFI9_9EUKA|nr:hypothetical protein KIPB_003066 [Kipferlia bialata]|eukprot:g3066.t1
MDDYNKTNSTCPECMRECDMDKCLDILGQDNNPSHLSGHEDTDMETGEGAGEGEGEDAQPVSTLALRSQFERVRVQLEEPGAGVARALKTLAEMAGRDDDSATLLSLGSHLLVVRALKAYPSNAKIAASAAGVTWIMSSGGPECKKALLDAGILRLLQTSLTTHSTDQEVLIPSMITLNNLSIDDPECINAMYEMGVHTVLIVVCQANVDHELVAKSACEVLGNMTSVDLSSRPSLVSIEMAAFLTFCLHAYGEDQEFTSIALSVMVNCVCEATFLPHMVGSLAHVFALRAIQEYPGSCEVVTKAIIVLTAMSHVADVGDDFRRVLYDCGTGSVLVNTLQAYVHDLTVCELCVECMGEICLADGVEASMAALGCPAAAVEALTTHPASVMLAENVGRLIGLLCHGGEDVSSKIVLENGIVPHILRHLREDVSAIAIAGNNPDATETTLPPATDTDAPMDTNPMSAGTNLIETELRASGVVRRDIEGQDPKEALLEMRVQMLGALCLLARGADINSMMYDLDVHTTATNYLKEYPSHLGVNQYAIGIICNMAYEDKECNPALFNMETYALLEKRLTNNKMRTPEVLDAILSCISNLVEHEPLRQPMYDRDLHVHVLKTLEEFPDFQIAMGGMDILYSLSTAVSARQIGIVAAGAVPIILRTLKNHGTDAKVAKDGLRALANLAEAVENRPYMRSLCVLSTVHGVRGLRVLDSVKTVTQAHSDEDIHAAGLRVKEYLK